MAHVDRPLLEVALDGPGKAAQALLQQLNNEDASVAGSSNGGGGGGGARGPDDRPALLTGKCELLGDGLDTGSAAKDLATQARVAPPFGTSVRGAQHAGTPTRDSCATGRASTWTCRRRSSRSR